MRGKHIAFILLGFLMAAPAYGRMDDDTQLPKRELLLLQEVPVVITPAKVAQPILESPSTITVLTRDDIRRYGATSFSDILRNVPGVDVMSVSATDRNVSMRGFNQLAAGRILSLVDNRPIYLDFYGITLWEFLPVSIDEIERVEIIRGPGSALYGANAFDGVVNIITDSSPTAIGTKMIAAVNQFGKLSGSMVHSGKAGALTYKASAGRDRISGWDDEDIGQDKRFNGRLHYAIGDAATLSLSGGIQDNRGDLLGSSDFSRPAKYDLTTNHLKLDYVRSGLKCRASWRQIVGNMESREFLPYQLEDNTFDTDLQHSFRPLDSNLIIWGLDYQFFNTDSDMLDVSHSHSRWAVYIQDQFQLSKTLALTAGLRYDRYTMTGNNFSPRGSIVYSPAIGHAFRASAGRAFRDPSVLHSHISMDYEKPVNMIPVPVRVKVFGNEELSPERITSYELGYQGFFGARLKVGVDMFSNRLKGLVDFYPVDTYDENALFPGSPGGVIPAAMSPVNGRDAEAQGGEVSADLSITRWLSAYANYSYQHVTDSKTEKRLESAPLHKTNAGLYAKVGARRAVPYFSINLFANHVDKTVWEGVKVDPYTMLNSVIRYGAFDGRAEIALSVSNLLNDRHLEHPLGREIGRSIALSLMYHTYFSWK